jgi:endonuclease YncB( thermonuclease family)
VKLWKVCRGLRAWHAPQKQQGTRETLKGPAALTARAKRVGVFNDKKNVPKPDRESDSSIVARGKTRVWKRVKGRTG